MKKIAIFLVLVLTFSFTSCGSVKEKVAKKVEEKVEEKVAEEVKKAEKELKEVQADTEDKEDSTEKKKEKKDKRKPVDKKNKKNSNNKKEDENLSFKDKAAKSEELAMEIFEEVKGDLIYDVSSVFAYDFDKDGEDEGVIVTSYKTENDVVLSSMAYYIDLSERTVVNEIRVDDYAASEPMIVEFEGSEDKFLYFLVENGANLQGLLLYNIYDDGFGLSMMGVPSMPPGYVSLFDENEDGIYEGVEEELMNVEVFYYPTTALDYYAQGGFYADYISVDLGEYPKTPSEVVKQYLYALHLRDARFTNASEVYGLDERLAELVTEDALTPEVHFANDILTNTAMEIEPKLVFEEEIYDENSANVKITIAGNYVDDASGRTSENFGFGMGLLKEDGKWKINGAYSLY